SHGADDDDTSGHARALTTCDSARPRRAPRSTVNVVHARELANVLARHLPRALHDPRERPIQAPRLALDLIEHRPREVEALLPLVGLVAVHDEECTAQGPCGSTPT